MKNGNVFGNLLSSLHEQFCVLLKQALKDANKLNIKHCLHNRSLHSDVWCFAQIDTQSFKAHDKANDDSISLGRCIRDVEKNNKVKFPKGLGNTGFELLASAVKFKSSLVSIGQTFIHTKHFAQISQNSCLGVILMDIETKF